MLLFFHTSEHKGIGADEVSPLAGKEVFMEIFHYKNHNQLIFASMKILLIGDFSGLHWTLAQGLRALGHTVCVASDGNGWKNYPRDISITRKDNSFFQGLLCLMRILKNLHRFRGYDVVQIIHPYFLRLRSERTLPVYRYLRRHNKKVFMGAFGTDHFYVKACMETDTFRYSDFKVGDRLRDIEINRADLYEHLHGGTVKANKEIAETCNGIIACLWEYYQSYIPFYPEKLAFIPLPVNLSDTASRIRTVPDKINFFIGIQSARSELKGTDIMYPVLKEIQKKYPDQCRISEAIDIPYAQYQRLMDEADVLLDQLYSYTPSMNSLLAMAKGIIVVGGGEEENYEIINEKELRPIINVRPSEEDIYQKLEYLVLNKEQIPKLSAQSIEYVKRHHDHIKVARQYIDFWEMH